MCERGWRRGKGDKVKERRDNEKRTERQKMDRVVGWVEEGRKEGIRRVGWEGASLSSASSRPCTNRSGGGGRVGFVVSHRLLGPPHRRQHPPGNQTREYAYFPVVSVDLLLAGCSLPLSFPPARPQQDNSLEPMGLRILQYALKSKYCPEVSCGR